MQEASILHEIWPTVGTIDETLLQASSYLMEAAHSFRLQKKNYSQSVHKKIQKKSANHQSVSVSDNVGNPTHGVVWIAKTFPPWQSLVLTTLSTLYAVIQFFMGFFNFPRLSKL